MRTDPRRACANVNERLFWALVHDGLAHPLMALTCFSDWSVRFHDWTSFRAWPRKTSALEPVSVLRTNDFDIAEAYAERLKISGESICRASLPQDDGSYVYEVRVLNLQTAS